MDEPHKIRSLGQHFLREPRIARRIIDAADMSPTDTILEIGPGGGVLTRELLEVVTKGKVVAVEADERFAKLLAAEKFPRFELVIGDALQIELEKYGPFDRIVANLPYQISGPITFRFLELLEKMPWKRAVLMFQKEFADRLLAPPGGADYGRLSIHVQRLVAISKVRDVPPGCFDPPPKVNSTVVQLDPHAASPYAVADEVLFRAIVDGTFTQRRKKLRNTVPTFAGPHGYSKEKCLIALEKLKIAEKRPQELAGAEFAALVGELLA